MLLRRSQIIKIKNYFTQTYFKSNITTQPSIYSHSALTSVYIVMNVILNFKLSVASYTNAHLLKRYNANIKNVNQQLHEGGFQLEEIVFEQLHYGYTGNSGSEKKS